MKKILISQYIPDEVAKRYEKDYQLFYPTKEKGKYTKEELTAEISDKDAVLVIGLKVDAQVLEAGKQLTAVANLGVGYDNIDYQIAGQKKIYVVNTPESVVQPTSELAIALMLAAARSIVKLDRDLRKTARTGLPAFSDMSLSTQGKTLGLIGLGRIGKEVARKAKAFGMDIIYYDLYQAGKEVEEELGARYMSLEELLKQADFVSLHCPYSKEMHHLIDDKSFNLMKPTAYLINAARGPLVDELALAEALRTGKIKGAGLDVFEFEPAVSQELLGLENITIVPHVGTHCYDVRVNMANEALRGLCACLEGDIPGNVVNQAWFPQACAGRAMA